MIRKLRKKFILIASGAILIILVVVMVSINLVTYVSTITEIDSILEFILDNDGQMPTDFHHNENFLFRANEELPYETRYFSMILDSTGTLVMTDYEHIASVSSDNFLPFILYGLKRNKGRIEDSDGIYFFQKKQISQEDLAESYPDMELTDSVYILIVFMDGTNRIYRFRNMQLFFILSGVFCFIMFFILVSVFSNKAIQPTIEAYEKQKRFITDAGHELKTPLAIISANTEVIEAMDGKSEWTESILNQVKRLSGLVNDLITLARLEEAAERDDVSTEEIAFSAKVKEVAEAFRPVLTQQGKQFSDEIAENINIKGNLKSVHELISILVDNAVKYCDDSGTVSVVLSARKKYAVLTVTNDYKDGENVDYTKFFDRFYREDSSRNSAKSGYGIGLSMAENIVNLHKGKISAGFADGKITFTVLLPL